MHATTQHVPALTGPDPALEAPGASPTWAETADDASLIDLSICIANWNCKEYLRACLTSLRDPQGLRLETIVVDNASTDGAADMVAREFPEVVLVRNPENTGFARASNQAASRARGRYLFFLNNDTEVPPYSLRELVHYAEAHPRAGMIGPRLRDGNGNLQISFRGKPTLAAMLHRTTLLNWTSIFKSAYEDYRRKHFQPNEERVVDVLMGAAVLMPRELFDRCGRWDEDFRFGVEDVELSVRVGKTNELVYLPHIELVHHGRLSSRSNVTFAAPNLLIGYVHFFRKTGTSRAAIVAYKVILTIDTPVRVVVKTLQGLWRRLVGRRKEAERSRLAARGLLYFLCRDLLRFWRA
jgi:N-acetylglucosaminyl-diphospho-decaprenol L-rhamnosyltransferase